MTTSNHRSFGEVALDEPTAAAIQKGTLNYTYRGVPMWKCPFDLALYMQVLWEIKPKTILEFGSKAGGSALWLADMLTSFGLTKTALWSLDIKPVTTINDSRIRFGKIDVARPQDFLEQQTLESIEHPLLIIDDASHQYAHVKSLLNFLHPHLVTGDYLIVEDGIVDRLNMADHYEGGPLRAIREFMSEQDGKYQIDRNRCDAFGHNVTWNVEGYIRRL